MLQLRLKMTIYKNSNPKSGSINGKSNFFFEALNGATKLTATADLNLKSFKLGEVIVKRKIYKQLKKDMLQLKSVLENGSKG